MPFHARLGRSGSCTLPPGAETSLVPAQAERIGLLGYIGDALDMYLDWSPCALSKAPMLMMRSAHAISPAALSLAFADSRAL